MKVNLVNVLKISRNLIQIGLKSIIIPWKCELHSTCFLSCSKFYILGFDIWVSFPSIGKVHVSCHFYRTQVYLGSDLWVASVWNKLSDLLQVIQVMQVIDSIQRRWPFLVALSGGQICNTCKWCHLVAKFATNASVILAGEIIQVKESIPWVRCASGNV